MRNNTGIIGITMGDPAGVGPEICMKALPLLQKSGKIPLFIGRFDVLQKNIPFSGIHTQPVTFSSVWDLKKSLPLQEKKQIYICDVHEGEELPEPGHGTVLTGAQSLNYIDTAIELWKEGLIDGIVTGPVSKSLIEKSGVPFTGHTEYIAEETGGDPFMMMYSPEYSVILVTTHLPIQKVFDSITLFDIEKTIKTAYTALKRIRKREPKIAVAGLDPHCGDDGAIGTFDRDITKKAVSNKKKDGINVTGPFAADTLFIPDTWKQYDVAVAMYHDQGLIPFKMCAFDTGVNVTLGLPVVRTSVDHGTAFDIAGKGKASHTSLVEAFSLACLLLEE